MSERTITVTQTELETIIRESYERSMDPPEAAEAAFSWYDSPPAAPGGTDLATACPVCGRDCTPDVGDIDETDDPGYAPQPGE